MKNKIALLLLFITITLFSEVAPRPNPPRLFNNLSKEYPDFLSVSEANTLESKLQNFSRETSNQICIVIVDDLGGTDASSYAIEVGNTWGVGNKDFNNGVVILIKPTGGAGGRDLFIAVGYGLEGAIPDLVTKRIREDEMYPYLKNGQNYKALNNAVEKLMAFAKGEINVKEYSKNRDAGGWIKAIIIIIIIMIIVGRFFGGGGGRTYGGGYYKHRGGFGGGFSGGSSSSGGFGGFGGGSFGGGGSGGKW